MVERKVTVELSTGLQARPAAKFVQEANRFSADIFIEKDRKRINGKSIMGLMSLAIGSGEEILLQADGSDEQDAINELATFVRVE
ncbi:HPr family phosphocarrier protein [Virgibacillus sp. MSP4-1]|uniref:HPr family phosphocarrier protein n=1 Tax=Virgibacillus sp. MSP4-1 TaxID=2700081 RepID=UPI0003A6D1C1|nr:HPr family phosphocarrier protein [Virgibacillus sp. MSP4-1]QHS23238.1 HPr family phosphocarrier protein [Virgibacillus sp. MSP4-1]